MVNYVQPAGSAFEPWGVEQQLVRDIDNAENPSAMRMLMGYAAQRMGANIDQQRAQQQVLGLQQQQSAVEQRQHNVKSMIDMAGAITKNAGAGDFFTSNPTTAGLIGGSNISNLVNTAKFTQGLNSLTDAGNARNAGLAVDPAYLTANTGLPISVIPTAGERSAAASGGGENSGINTSYTLPPVNGVMRTPLETMTAPTVRVKVRPGETPQQAIDRSQRGGGGAPSVVNNSPARAPAQTATPQSAATPTTPPPPNPTQNPNGTNTLPVQGRAIKALNDMQATNRQAAQDVVAGSVNGQPQVVVQGDRLFMLGASGAQYPVP